MKQYLALDLGGTFIKYAIITETANILCQGKIPSPTDNMQNLLAALTPLHEKFNGQYEGVAVSMPGRIDTANGIAHTGGSFTFIWDEPLAQKIEQCLHAPTTIANDGKCAANAEAWNGVLRDVSNGAVIVLGTGTAGGIVLDGKVLMGSSFSAGEFSMIGADFGKLARGVRSLADDISALWCDKMSARGLLMHYAARKEIPYDSVDGYSFFEAYEAGEKEAAETLDEFGRYAAAGIYSLQAVLDLQKIAIGGGISARPEVEQVIQKAVKKQFEAIPLTPFSQPQITTCHYKNDANLIGALRFHLSRIRE